MSQRAPKSSALERNRELKFNCCQNLARETISLPVMFTGSEILKSISFVFIFFYFKFQ